MGSPCSRNCDRTHNAGGKDNTVAPTVAPAPSRDSRETQRTESRETGSPEEQKPFIGAGSPAEIHQAKRKTPIAAACIFFLLALACMGSGIYFYRDAAKLYYKWFMDNTFDKEDSSKTSCIVLSSGYEIGEKVDGTCKSFARYEDPMSRTAVSGSKCPGQFALGGPTTNADPSQSLATNQTIPTLSSRLLGTRVSSENGGAREEFLGRSEAALPSNARRLVSTAPVPATGTTDACWKIPWAMVKVGDAADNETAQCAFINGWGTGEDLSKVGDVLPEPNAQISCYLWKKAVSLSSDTTPGFLLPKPFFETDEFMGKVKPVLFPVGLFLLLISCCLGCCPFCKH
mmetsp:Transcript_43353/g.68637  ORF Transcript_43353/g.68637 Transcript_43353/m.68637 type:complete len:343 (+) Transcript_43353:52-1080(+)